MIVTIKSFLIKIGNHGVTPALSKLHEHLRIEKILYGTKHLGTASQVNFKSLVGRLWIVGSLLGCTLISSNICGVSFWWSNKIFRSVAFIRPKFSLFFS